MRGGTVLARTPLVAGNRDPTRICKKGTLLALNSGKDTLDWRFKVVRVAILPTLPVSVELTLRFQTAFLHARGRRWTWPQAAWSHLLLAPFFQQPHVNPREGDLAGVACPSVAHHCGWGMAATMARPGSLVQPGAKGAGLGFWDCATCREEGRRNSPKERSIFLLPGD